MLATALDFLPFALIVCEPGTPALVVGIAALHDQLPFGPAFVVQSVMLEGFLSPVP